MTLIVKLNMDLEEKKLIKKPVLPSLQGAGFFIVMAI